jgi:hypothetical protein
MRSSTRSVHALLSLATLGAFGALGVLGVASLSGCGTPTLVILASHREDPDSVRRLMRGGARLGCSVSPAYSRAAGLVLECKEGRMVIGKRSGENKRAPGHPLQITCTRELADKCESFYTTVWKAGEPACGDDEVVAGCGALQCSPPDDAPDVCEKMTADN